MEKTKIDWCNSTWNPVTGCFHNCTYCYARSIAKRFALEDLPTSETIGVKTKNTYMGQDTMFELDRPYKATQEGKVAAYPTGFLPTLHEYRLRDYKDKKGRNIFVCSMADLFGDWVPDEWIEQVFKACKESPQHNYLFLTKNPQRYLDLQTAGKLPNSNNMWYGASTTTVEQIEKTAKVFRKINCDTKLFLSIEPLLGDITKTDAWHDICEGRYVNWVIVGAESGNRKNKVVPELSWLKYIYVGCHKPNGTVPFIPLFMKDSLDGIWDLGLLLKEFPPELQRRETDEERKNIDC